MVTVLIFMVLAMIISGATLSIVTKQGRLAEDQIRRIRAFYAAESAINKAYHSLTLLNIATFTPPNCSVPNAWCLATDSSWQWEWNGEFEWDTQLSLTKDIRVIYNPTGAPITVGTVALQPDQLNATVDYAVY